MISWQCGNPPPRHSLCAAGLPRQAAAAASSSTIFNRRRHYTWPALKILLFFSHTSRRTTACATVDSHRIVYNSQPKSSRISQSANPLQRTPANANRQGADTV